MIYREAEVRDIPELMRVRHAVKENVLQNPAAITEEDCREYLIDRGKGWVCEQEGKILGFGIVDLRANNIWALFVHPDGEKRGIGKRLHTIMINWYFSKKEEPLWLGTDPGTRAEVFYQKNAWKVIGLRENGEVKMEMSMEAWKTKGPK